MAQETNQSQAPLLCTTGCGFYGNPGNIGMCSVCYKDLLQRQNSNGLPGSSSSDSSIRDCVLAQCSDSTTVTLPAAISPPDTECGHSSGTRTSSTTSTGESTSRAKTSLAGSCRAVRAASVGSEQKGQCCAGSSGTASSSQRTVLKNSPSVKHKERKHKKRKVEDPDETIDVERASVSEVSVDPPAETEEKPKAKKKRCFTCRKKVYLTGFDCRCGNVFCSIHRYSDVHNCTFDYKADAAERIRKDNPVIVGEKIHKI